MKKLILIAEDDAAIVEVMKIILQDAGYEIITLNNGKKVIETVQQKNPDLMLLDIWLSGEDGGEIARQLRKGKKKSTPIIMISANNETEQIAKEAGADGFLRKPFDINDLLEIVKKYIR